MENTISKELLEFLRQQFPKGSRIQLREMGADEPRPIKSGSMGTLEHIDDIGTFHVAWDDGRSLGLIIGQDRFLVLPPEPTLLKLYMPLTANLYRPSEYWNAPSEYWDMGNTRTALDARRLCAYEGSILRALNNACFLEENERGLMRWYDEEDSVNEKVKSFVFTVEERDGRLWGVAECRVVGTLTPKEMAALADYIEAQAADGWGESFAQREIRVDGDAELYVSFWNRGDWSIKTEKELFESK